MKPYEVTISYVFQERELIRTYSLTADNERMALLKAGEKFGRNFEEGCEIVSYTISSESYRV